ncbi:hypothetical protein GCM10009540_31640 [Streptomyces turgidiscabies]
MVVEQLPGQVREFARYLNGLLARLDQGAGWCGVFWERDPDGMRACLEGYEVPPWDVVDALLQDLAAGYGTGTVAPESEQARALHRAALAAFDTRPGARDTLGDRLDVMLREQKYAAERLAELGRSLASAASHEEAEGLRLDLAWAHDDHERASARCVELRYRLDQLARRAVSRAPFQHRDRDDEADLFTGRPQRNPHPADAPAGDPLPLPRQRTHPDEQHPADTPATWYTDGARDSGHTTEEAGAPGPGDEASTWRAGSGRPSDADGSRPAAYGDGRQGPGGESPAWRDGARENDDLGPGRRNSGEGAPAWRDGSGRDGSRPAAAYDEDRSANGPGSGDESSAWSASARYGGDRSSGRRDADDDASTWRSGAHPAAYVDDRDLGRRGPGDEAAAWRDGVRRAGRAADQGGAHPAAYVDDHDLGRQAPGDEAPAWRDAVRRTGRAADQEGGNPAAYGDGLGPGRRDFGDGAPTWRDGTRRTGRDAEPDGTTSGGDRVPGGQDSGDGVSVGRGGGRRSGQGDDPAGARQDDAPGGSTAPQLPADWYEPSVPAPAPAPEPAPAERRPASKQRAKRRARGSARFAGMIDDADTGATPDVDPTGAPVMPAPAATPGRRNPRGARFAGAGAAAKSATPVRVALDDDARHDTIDTVRTLVRLRGEGRTGEAHALLVEASQWPAARFPLLAAELHRAGLGADWATLLWEAASLPADRLVAAADALVAAGRATDGEQILRQGMARPAQEVGEAVLRLAEKGSRREVRALLDAYVRVRTPEEAARSVAADPQRLVPLLLEAARGASEDRYWDLVHALRVAGHSA